MPAQLAKWRIIDGDATVENLSAILAAAHIPAHARARAAGDGAHVRGRREIGAGDGGRGWGRLAWVSSRDRCDGLPLVCRAAPGSGRELRHTALQSSVKMSTLQVSEIFTPCRVRGSVAARPQRLSRLGGCSLGCPVVRYEVHSGVVALSGRSSVSWTRSRGSRRGASWSPVANPLSRILRRYCKPSRQAGFTIEIETAGFARSPMSSVPLWRISSTSLPNSRTPVCLTNGASISRSCISSAILAGRIFKFVVDQPADVAEVDTLAASALPHS